MNRDSREKHTLLIAEDDRHDRELLARAFHRCGSDMRLEFVANGKEMLKYLKRLSPFDDKDVYPWPDLILLDLNMPLLDGREVLATVRQDNQLSKLPIVIFSSSAHPDDIDYCYRAGANSYLTKPQNFSDLVEMASSFFTYWFEKSLLPSVQ